MINCLICSSYMCVSTQWDFPLNYLRDIPTKLFVLWKSCQNPKLYISQTELGFSTFKLVLCSASSFSSDSIPYFRLKTLDFPMYSTSFQSLEGWSFVLLASASTPTPLCLSSGPQHLYLGMSQFILSSFTLAPLIHHTCCHYQFHLLVSGLLTHQTLLKTLHIFNLLTAVISYVVPWMKSCPETPVYQLDKSRLFWSYQESILDHCPSSSLHSELSRRDFE